MNWVQTIQRNWAASHFTSILFLQHPISPLGLIPTFLCFSCSLRCSSCLGDFWEGSWSSLHTRLQMMFASSEPLQKLCICAQQHPGTQKSAFQHCPPPPPLPPWAGILTALISWCLHSPGLTLSLEYSSKSGGQTN